MKHYIRINENKCITHGFSDSIKQHREQILETDICINKEGGRQFELSYTVDDEIITEVNPSLKDENGILRFKQYYNKPTLRIEEEKQSELDTIFAEQQRIEILKELSNLDNPRETEELIDVLITLGIISETDLPTVIMDKIKLKKELRLQL